MNTEHRIYQSTLGKIHTVTDKLTGRKQKWKNCNDGKEAGGVWLRCWCFFGEMHDKRMLSKEDGFE